MKPETLNPKVGFKIKGLGFEVTGLGFKFKVS